MEDGLTIAICGACAEVAGWTIWRNGDKMQKSCAGAEVVAGWTIWTAAMTALAGNIAPQ